MNFLYPSFLYALGFMAVPVIIHFFNFRKFKTQEFTQVKFLEQATKVRRRFRQMRDLLIMLFRMLAIACLVLAFAHPVPEDFGAKSQEHSLVSIYLDNSFSMGLEGENGELFSQAKAKVEEVVEGFGDESLFQLITNDLESSSRDFIEKDLLLQNLETVQLGPQILAQKELTQIQNSDLKKHTGNRVQVWVSDFQKINFPINQFESDSLIKTYWLPLQVENASNLTIDSAWFEQAVFVKGQTARLKVRIKNFGNENVEERAVYVSVNGVQRAMQSVSLLPQEEKMVELFYAITNTGWNDVKINIEDYPIEFDNEIFSTYYVSPNQKVLLVYDKTPNAFITTVYNNNENFILDKSQIGQIDLAKIASYDLVITDEVQKIPSGVLDKLYQFVNGGGNLLLIPPVVNELTDLKDIASKFNITFSAIDNAGTSIKELDLNNSFFADIFDGVPKNTDFPKVFKHYKTGLNTRSSARPIISLNNGDAYLYENEIGAGRAFIFSTPLNLEWTNMVKNGLFLPLLYKFATYKGSQNANTFFIDQEPSNTSLTNSLVGKVLGLFKDEVSFVPNYVLKNGKLTIFEDEISDAGFYTVQDIDGADSAYLHLGFNYNRRESDFSFWTNEELATQSEIKGVEIVESANNYVTGVFKDLTNKNRFWQYFLIAAFCFLLFEIIAIKLPFK